MAQPAPEMISPPAATEPVSGGAAPSNPEAWTEASWLYCTLSVGLPVPSVTVGDILRLDVGTVLDTRQIEGSPLPVWVNGVKVGWGEIDVMADQLAVRLTALR